MARRTFLRLIAVVAVAAAACAARPFTVLFFNDFHSHLEPFTPAGQAEEVGGAARLAGVVREIRAANEAAGVPTFVLVAGDALQGSPYSSAYRGEAEFAFLNELGVDAMCLGNHEFDYGRDNLVRLTDGARFSVLAANVVHGGGDREGSSIWAQGTWLYADGRGILVVGLTTPDTPYTTALAATEGLAFGEPAAAIRAVMARFPEEPSPVIALTHLGFEEDIKLAQEVPEIDIVIGGHSHTKVDAAEVVGTTVIGQAYCYGGYLGRMDLEFDGRDGVKLVKYELIPVTVAAPDDPAVAAVVTKYKDGLSKELETVVAETSVSLNYASGRTAESNFGDFVADALREATKADAAVVNAGAIRADLPAGKITAGNVMTALPYSNQVIVVRLKGNDLKAALDYWAREKVGSGGFLQISGIGCVLRPGVGASEVTVAGQPLDEDATYSVAMSDFLSSGGDGYGMFVTPDATPTGLVVNDVILNALRAGASVPAAPQGRTTVAAP